jgi:hypothetical protein
MRFIILLSFTVFGVFFISHNANAQGWWEKAKKFMNSDTSQKSVKSLQQDSGIISQDLTNTEIGEGLREVLLIGTEKVVSQIGQVDGFNLDPKIHIPLPSTLVKTASVLSSVGMGSLTEDLELRLNRAAESATPLAKELFIQAISKVTIDDARNILNGSQDAATKYLRSTMGHTLGQQMVPIVDKTLSESGAVQAYDAVIGEYSQVPFMPDVKANLNDYVVKKALDGIFYYVGKEEAVIRANPAARTTNLLKRVFAEN